MVCYRMYAIAKVSVFNAVSNCDSISNLFYNNFCRFGLMLIYLYTILARFGLLVDLPFRTKQCRTKVTKFFEGANDKVKQTSNPSSPVYPHLVTRQPSTPNTFVVHAFMNFIVDKSTPTPFCTTSAAFGPIY